MSLHEPITDELLKSNFCLEAVDRVPHDPETTAFKRRARLNQALWRNSKGLPIGSQPMRPSVDKPHRPLGSRIELRSAQETLSNFLNEDVRQAVRDRLAHPQAHQTLNADRLHCDLLSSMPMCFNLFGTLRADLDRADTAVHTWWSNVPGRVSAVHFEWSPGRRITGQYLENRSAFDVAFELDLGNGRKGLLGVETKYHEDCKRENVPSEHRLKRYAEVSNASGIMSEASINKIVGTELQQIWLDHLLSLSMTQHLHGQWDWAEFVLVHPEKNPSYGRATDRYRSLLKDPSSIRVSSIESLLAGDAFLKTVGTDFSERYLW